MSQQYIGRYRILERVAAGGQATVYRAWDGTTGQVVALKVLHPHLAHDASYIERFHREACLTVSIDHANIVRIFEVEKDEDSHFISMEYLPESLHHVLESGGRFTVEQAVGMVHQVSLGLQAAYEAGVEVHRDIKPQNILVASDGTLKVTDFGIARAADQSGLTRTGAVMGTPHFMSPEQAQGERVDIRADIYGLGVVLYQLHANNLNRFFSVSLETQEVRDIAYSVSTWTWARPALNHAPEVQAARGRRSGQSRRDANAGRNLTIRDLKDDDWTVEDIAAIIGIHRSTVYRVMKSASRYLDTNRVNVARTCQGGGLPGMQSQPPTLIRRAQPAAPGAKGAGKGGTVNGTLPSASMGSTAARTAA